MPGRKRSFKYPWEQTSGKYFIDETGVRGIPRRDLETGNILPTIKPLGKQETESGGNIFYSSFQQYLLTLKKHTLRQYEP